MDDDLLCLNAGFEDFAPDEEALDAKTPARALVLVAHGRALGLEWTCPRAMQEFLENSGACVKSPYLEFDSIDHDEKMPDGLYLCDLRFQDAGPSDWPGTREVEVQAFDWRPATADEWKSFCAGEPVWDTT